MSFIRRLSISLFALTLAACESNTGATGAKGDQGEPGRDGEDGEDGADGAAGADGVDGVDGADGTDGVDGLNGVDGADGEDGEDGEDGLDGTPGVDGQDGTDGQDGVDGLDGHDGAAPWGVHVEILTVEGGSGAGGQLIPGDVPVVTFGITDDAGTAYDLADLSTVGFQLAGPIEHPQILSSHQDLGDTRSSSVYNGDGTWTYTFAAALPTTYAPVPNDTTDLGEDDGDWGGLAVEDGTYTLAAWAWLAIEGEDGSIWYDAGNTTSAVLVGAATDVESREVVLDTNCANCHGDTPQAHGGGYSDLAVCQTCHVAGAEDHHSDVDASTTPGVTIAWRTMVHQIHMGASLREDLVINGAPLDATLDGYPDYNAYDYADVAFPAWPMGAATCASCHEGAADEAAHETPTRDACGSCHDGVDWATGTGHGGGAQTNDAYCTYCHVEGGIAPSVDEAHMDLRADPTFNAGLNVEILSAVDGAGDTIFDPGDTITITYTVKDDAGNDVDDAYWSFSPIASTCGTTSGRGNAVFTGPTHHMEKLFYSYNPSVSLTTGSMVHDSTYDASTGVYTYTFGEQDGSAYVIPSTFPSLQGDGTSLQLDGSDGDWTGLDLPDGTYRIAIDLYTTLWEDPTCASTSRWRVATSAFLDVPFGSATTIEPRAVVDDASCNACHTTIEFHGETRVGVDYCVMCHTAGSGEYDFPSVIHLIHASGQLGGFTVGAESFDVRFPRQDGGVEACAACHGEGIAIDPSTRGCITCHDSDDAKAHAALNTDDTYGESCDVCHGEGATFAADVVHDPLD